MKFTLVNVVGVLSLFGFYSWAWYVGAIGRFLNHPPEVKLLIFEESGVFVLALIGVAAIGAYLGEHF
jgi:hypothetical protein